MVQTGFVTQNNRAEMVISCFRIAAQFWHGLINGLLLCTSSTVTSSTYRWIYMITCLAVHACPAEIIDHYLGIYMYWHRLTVHTWIAEVWQGMDLQSHWL